MKTNQFLAKPHEVRATLDGQQTQFRRIIKPQPELSESVGMIWKGGCYGIKYPGTPRLVNFLKKCPYGQPGNVLWVRETWAEAEERNGAFWYRAGVPVIRAGRFVGGFEEFNPITGCARNPETEKWKPSLFMPRIACRLWLKITNVRVERLNEISEADAEAEGIQWNIPEISYVDYLRPKDGYTYSAAGSFQTLWESINGPGSWEANQWVWVVEFRRVEGGAA